MPAADRALPSRVDRASRPPALALAAALAAALAVGCVERVAPAGASTCSRALDCLQGWSCVAGLCVVSDAPGADAGPDQTVHVGQLVLLDGSATADRNGDALSCR